MGWDVVDYGEFSAELHQSIYAGERFPSNVSIEVTRRCPLTCAHCYNNLPMGDVEARNAEPTYAELCHMMDEMAEAGTLWVLFTGGEIFARKDFLDIYTYAKQKGFIITLFTNGTLLTPEIADYLVEWRPFSIEITLYGHTKETYEALTGVAGSWEKCRRGVELLLERGLPLTLKTVAVTINRHEVFEMKRFAEERGCDFRYDLLMSPRIDCSKSPLAVRLTPEEVVEVEIQDERRARDWQEFAERFGGRVHTGEKTKGIYACGGGHNDFAIHADGRMGICISSRKETYDLKNGNFDEGWNDFLGAVRSKPITVRTKCVECAIKGMCSMCPANGELENDNPEKPVDYLCQVAHLRAHAFEVEIPAHGDCEYCAGGAGYDNLLASVARLREKKERLAIGRPIKTNKYLPVLGTAGTTEAFGGCGSCTMR
jgi:radical SAM protein with 4Fe4S-binding SPASM domain